MFLKERQDAIVTYVHNNGRATVSELSRRFKVSEDCIRKDLKQLSNEGVLKRVYGGAISAKIPVVERSSIYSRLVVNVEEKRIIAEKAYGLIHSGETIFLDISTTNVELAKLLAAGEKNCIIYSNMLDVLQTLAPNQNLTVYATGGKINLELNGFVGALTLSVLQGVIPDKAFLGAISVDLHDGAVYTFDLDDGLVKQCVLTNSRHSFLMADSNKFGKTGSFRYASLSEFDNVITNIQTPELTATFKRLHTNCL
jgi:DeoR/GlpR family transcriptional regulator of sugar metabolism